MSRNLGIQLQNIGMIIIITVLLLDNFVFQIQDGFIFACVIVGTVSLGAGILIRTKNDFKGKFSKRNNKHE